MAKIRIELNEDDIREAMVLYVAKKYPDVKCKGTATIHVTPPSQDGPIHSPESVKIIVDVET